MPRPVNLASPARSTGVRDAVVVADVESANIVVWNPAAEALFGYTAEQATTLPLEDLIPDELKAAHRNELRHFRESGHGSVIDGGRPVEFVGIRADGGRIHIELTLSTLSNAQGRYLLALVRDISDRR